MRPAALSKDFAVRNGFHLMPGLGVTMTDNNQTIAMNCILLWISMWIS